MRAREEKAGQPEQSCTDEAASFPMSTGLLSQRRDKETKFGVFGHATCSNLRMAHAAKSSLSNGTIGFLKVLSMFVRFGSIWGGNEGTPHVV